MKSRQKIKLFIVFSIIFVLILTGCNANIVNTNEGELIVHYIDIGQGDSIFIQLPTDETALIDGGPRVSSEKLVDYLNTLGVEKIDYLIATHPHEDHIGGLPAVIRKFNIHNIYMPNKTANTAIFEELLLEIKKKDLEINIASGGDTILDKEGLKIEIFGPNKESYSNTNDYSIVAKITYGDNSFLFTGDAEKTSEIEMIEKGYNLSSDVLKVGHHGSTTSTSESFLKEVNPKYGIISCEKGNTYGHPHKEIIELLNEYNVKVLRTDEQGTIVLTSDGKEISVDGYEEVKVEKANNEENYFIGNKNTKVYHYYKCNSLPSKENQIIFKTKEEAENNGYKPHNNCVKKGGE